MKGIVDHAPATITLLCSIIIFLLILFKSKSKLSLSVPEVKSLDGETINVVAATFVDEPSKSFTFLSFVFLSFVIS